MTDDTKCDSDHEVDPTPAALAALDKNQIAVLLRECLKPDEISGTQREERIHELLCWFGRFAQGMANPKWFRAHAFELAYYIATQPALLAATRRGAGETDELSRLTERLMNWLSLKEPDTYASRAEAFEWAARAHELAARAANLLELRAAEVAALQMVVRNR